MERRTPSRFRRLLGRRRPGGVAWALGVALVAGALSASPSGAATQVLLTGPESRGPIAPDANGRFSFPAVGLKRNSVNKFTVEATDDAGNAVSKEVSITQLSLESIVVSKVTATPLPPERVIQLVSDGVIDLDDPSNFNVSVFALVLTIGREEVPIEVSIALPKLEPMGSENIRLPRDVGSDGGSKPNPQDVEIIVFDQVVPCSTCAEPPRIPGVIVIEGAIKSLKEFFSVRLLLMNVSGLFTLSDVKASLGFPDGGLSATLPADGVVAFDEILPGDGAAPGQKEREFIVRGDEIGKRRVRVDFGGRVTGPGIPDDDPIPFSGAAEAEVEVKGPPQFGVRVSHPAQVVAGVPYELGVEITNRGDAAALFASLELDVGADAEFADCKAGETVDHPPSCEEVPGPLVRNLRHLYPGDVAMEKFTVVPKVSGDITSCVGVSDQNVTLEVLVGRIGCITGKLSPPSIEAGGAPTVHVLPFANAQGIGIDSPVTAFFSEKVRESSITTGAGGSFQVFDPAGHIAPGRLRFAELREKTVAIWQLADGITNRLTGNSTYTVVVTNEIRDLEGNALFNPWESAFTTTSPSDDRNPPTLTLSIEPGVDATRVLSGQIVRLNAYAADQGTGVSRIELRMRDEDAGDPGWTWVDQKSVFDQAEQGPCIFAIDSAQLLPGHTYQLRGTAFDGAGNVQDATIPIMLAASSAPPSIDLPEDPAQPVLAGISLPITPSTLSDGVRRVRFFLDGAGAPFATVGLAPFMAVVGTTDLALGAHVVLAVAEDGLGRTASDELAFELAENPSEPVVRFAGAATGSSFVQGAMIPVAVTAEDPVGVRSVHVALDDPAGAPLVTSLGNVQIDTAALSAGAHRLYAIATNVLGVSNTAANPGSYLEFMVRTPPNGPPPPAPVLSGATVPSSGRTTVTGSTGIPFGEVDVTNLASGFVARVTADASGAFQATLDAAGGDRLRVVVFDYATSQQPSAAAQAVVPAPPVLVGIEVSPAAVAFDALGLTQPLVVTARYGDGSSAVVTTQASFGSSASAVASVSAGGVVTAQGNGAAQVNAGFGGFVASVPVQVDAVVLTAIEVGPSSMAFVLLGESRSLEVVGVFSNGSRQPLISGLSFVSSAPAVASVTATGIVTSRANGAALVTVQRTGMAPVVVPVSVDSTQDPAPAVQIISPAPGTAVERGQLVQVVVRAQDAIGGVVWVRLTASGEEGFVETRPVAPPSSSTEQTFTLRVGDDAAIGGSISLRAEAQDTGGRTSAPAEITLAVVDTTAPAVSIQAPAPASVFNYGAPIPLTIAASDAVGVTQIRYETAGAEAFSGAEVVAPAQSLAAASFSLVVPHGPLGAELVIRAFARDEAGNEGRAADVRIQLTGADITAPETRVTSVTASSGPSAAVEYEVTAGLDDLDHVQLYFRRSGIGTFNRYTDAANGNPDGKFAPSASGSGTIAFDATRMGGDGEFEFFTVGVDRAGNRETPPGSWENPEPDTGATVAIASGIPVTVITSDTEIVGTLLDDRNLRVVGATVTLVGSHAFRNVELLEGAVLTHRETTASEAYGVEMTAWTLSVDATSRLDVTARGFLGGGRSGLPDGVAHSVGFAPGSESGTGGSYGGMGGWYAGAGSRQPAPVYGDLTNPMDLGSGGGAWSGDGGDGGGRVLVGAINVALDGAIRADGGVSSGSASGEGSGGSVNLAVRTISGRGSIEADGGTTGGGNHTGGGGGRIAIRFLDLATYALASVTARGGDGYYGDGADGTIFLLPEGQAGGELVINGTGPSSPLTDLVMPPGPDLRFDHPAERRERDRTGDDPARRTSAAHGRRAPHASERERGGSRDPRGARRDRRGERHRRHGPRLSRRRSDSASVGTGRDAGVRCRCAGGYRWLPRRHRRQAPGSGGLGLEPGLRRRPAAEGPRCGWRRVVRPGRKRRRSDPHPRDGCTAGRWRDPRRRRALRRVGVRRRRRRFGVDHDRQALRRRHHHGERRRNGRCEPYGRRRGPRRHRGRFRRSRCQPLGAAQHHGLRRRRLLRRRRGWNPLPGDRRPARRRARLRCRPRRHDGRACHDPAAPWAGNCAGGDGGFAHRRRGRSPAAAVRARRPPPQSRRPAGGDLRDHREHGFGRAGGDAERERCRLRERLRRRAALRRAVALRQGDAPEGGAGRTLRSAAGRRRALGVGDERSPPRRDHGELRRWPRSRGREPRRHGVERHRCHRPRPPRRRPIGAR